MKTLYDILKFFICMISINFSNSQVFLSVNDIASSIINTASSNEGLCADPSDFLKGKADKICIFANTDQIYATDDKIQSIKDVNETDIRSSIYTKTLYDNAKNKNLLMRMIYNFVNDDTPNLNKKRKLQTDLTYQLIKCTHFVYISYLNNIEYLTNRINSKNICQNDDECRQDLSSIGIVSNLFSWFNLKLFNSDDQKTGSSFSSIIIGKMTDDQILSNTHFLKSLKNITELDSAKPSIVNDPNCYKTALSFFDENTSTFAYTPWESSFDSLIKTYIQQDPISDYTPPIS